MKLSTAKLSYLRIAPRKVRLVADLIRGKKVELAEAILSFTNKRATEPLIKLLKQAIFNAKSKFQINPSDLYISKIIVNEGPKLKRWMPRARGRAYEIQKKSSHIILELNSKIEKDIKKAKVTKVKKREKTEEKEKIFKLKKFKTKPEGLEKKTMRPMTEKGIKKIFKRKAF